MIEDYLIKVIKECYDHEVNKNFEEFKERLNKYTSEINNCIGDGGFVFRFEGKIIKNVFAGKLILLDLKFEDVKTVWTNNLHLYLNKPYIDEFYDGLCTIQEPQWADDILENYLQYALGSYLIENYPNFVDKVIMLS
jgi:hypothetical protein